MTFTLSGIGPKSEERPLTRCLLSWRAGHFRLGYLPKHHNEVSDAWIDSPEAERLDKRSEYAESKVYASVSDSLVNLHGALIDDQSFDSHLTLTSKIRNEAG
jgi:hypothetical protein